ncbi:hypothetical protein [Kaistia sp. MMO-174]|uniref:hypothetical protein n=1 Tax=Kaistia sp. MMO-174 TaxID=3081256 RepID=UPI0030160982
MTQPLDPPLIDVARKAIAALFQAYCNATRMPLTLVSEVVSDDRAFVSRYHRSDLRISSYDRVVGRFSALWPAHVAWPRSVPRPPPLEVPPELMSKLSTREIRYSRALPPPSRWTADIPPPASANPET